MFSRIAQRFNSQLFKKIFRPSVSHLKVMLGLATVTVTNNTDENLTVKSLIEDFEHCFKQDHIDTSYEGGGRLDSMAVCSFMLNRQLEQMGLSDKSKKKALTGASFFSFSECLKKDHFDTSYEGGGERLNPMNVCSAMLQNQQANLGLSDSSKKKSSKNTSFSPEAQQIKQNTKDDKSVESTTNNTEKEVKEKLSDNPIKKEPDLFTAENFETALGIPPGSIDKINNSWRSIFHYITLNPDFKGHWYLRNVVAPTLEKYHNMELFYENQQTIQVSTDEQQFARLLSRCSKSKSGKTTSDHCLSPEVAIKTQLCRTLFTDCIKNEEEHKYDKDYNRRKCEKKFEECISKSFRK